MRQGADWPFGQSAKKRNFPVICLTFLGLMGIILKQCLRGQDPLAQLAEHLTFNQGVRSSNLRWITKNKRINLSKD